MPTTIIVIATIAVAAIMLSVTSSMKKKTVAPANPEFPELAPSEAELEKAAKTYRLLKKASAAVIALSILASAGSVAVNAVSRNALVNNETTKALMDGVHAIWEDNRKGNETLLRAYYANREERAQVAATFQDLLGQIPKDGFAVQAPYLVFSDQNYKNSDKETTYLIAYSGGLLLGDQAVDNAKTIIYAHHSYADAAKYNQINERGQNMGATGVQTYETELYYYDAESGAFIGYELLPAPTLSEKLSGSGNYLTNTDKQILAAVRERLTQ